VKELQDELDDCLRRIASGQSSIEDCLILYPEHQRELQPLLQTASRLGAGRDLQPSSAFRNNARTKAVAYARSHPPKSKFWFHPAWRLAVGLAVVVLALLATTTVLAQSALPGEPLYFWKRAAEEVWRAVTPDPVGADLDLVSHRTDELVAAANAQQAEGLSSGESEQPLYGLGFEGSVAQEDEALQGLHLALGRLNADDNPANQQRIENALKQEQKKLEKAGLHDKVLNDTINKGQQKKNQPNNPQPSP
jgi:hypothetical protein